MNTKYIINSESNYDEGQKLCLKFSGRVIKNRMKNEFNTAGFTHALMMILSISLVLPR